MKTMREMFGIKKGAVISAVDLIRGIGVYAGLEVINVEGATGLYTTNYEGKAEAAVEALRKNDFVYVHVEASDEAGHDGDVDLKVKTIEYLDHRLIRHIVEATQDWDEPVAIAVLPDHPTPCAIRTHTATPIPFLMYKPGIEPDAVKVFDEFSVLNGKYGILQKDEFIKTFLSL
jgi:2,3-bisphosphoglycerate-independent phosphoglycerate mutase